MAPDGLFAAYKEVLDEHGILFISDEVQTGWGRTGEHFWGIGAHGVTPDMMTFAKGLGNGFAIGGVVGRGDLMDGIRGNGISTFGGNPVATAAANATLDYVLSHDLQRTRPRRRDHHRRAAEAAAGARGVGEVRGKGLMFAVEMVDPATEQAQPAAGRRVLEETRERGLLIGKGGLYGSTLRMAPPLTLSHAEAERGSASSSTRSARSTRAPVVTQRARAHEPVSQARHALDRRQVLDGRARSATATSTTRRPARSPARWTSPPPPRSTTAVAAAAEAGRAAGGRVAGPAGQGHVRLPRAGRASTPTSSPR